MSRLIAWTAFLLGIGASTAANIAHAQDGNGWGPRLAAAFAPLALVLAVELAVRLRWRTGWRWTLARWGGTGLVGLVTAVVSYRHQSGLLGTYGEDSINAAILPLSIDGLMLVSAAALLSIGLDKSTRTQSSPGPRTVRAQSTRPVQSIVPSPVRSIESSPSVQRSERLSILLDSFPDSVPTSGQIKDRLGLKSQGTAHGLRTAFVESRAQESMDSETVED